MRALGLMMLISLIACSGDGVSVPPHDAGPVAGVDRPAEVDRGRIMPPAPPRIATRNSRGSR